MMNENNQQNLVNENSLDANASVTNKASLEQKSAKLGDNYSMLSLDELKEVVGGDGFNVTGTDIVFPDNMGNSGTVADLCKCPVDGNAHEPDESTIGPIVYNVGAFYVTRAKCKKCKNDIFINVN